MSSPNAVIVGSQVSINVSESYKDVRKVTSDRDITEHTIIDLVKVLLKYTDDSTAIRNLNNLKAYPIDSSKCNKAIELISSASYIEVVPSRENYHAESGLYKFVWERAQIVMTDAVLAHRQGDSLSALRARSHEAGLRITISQGAWDAMQRHTIDLERQESENAFRRRMAFQDQLRYQAALQRRQQSESHCCTIL